MKHRLKSPSPAFVISLLALFVALGGTAYAATSLPKNSVGTKQLKKAAVTGKKIKNHTIGKKKLTKKTVAALKGATGPQGPAGPTGATGAKGATGAQGIQGVKGDIGPAAGGYASSTTIVNLSATAASVVSTGAITAPAAGKLLVTGTASVQVDSSGGGDAFCDVRVSTNGGAFTRIGASNSYGQELPGAFDIGTITVTAGTAVAAGSTYNAALFCLNFNGAVNVSRANLTAVVVGG